MPNFLSSDGYQLLDERDLNDLKDAIGTMGSTFGLRISENAAKIADIVLSVSSTGDTIQQMQDVITGFQENGLQVPQQVLDEIQAAVVNAQTLLNQTADFVNQKVATVDQDLGVLSQTVAANSTTVQTVQTNLNNKQSIDEKGTPGGYASLGNDGLVPPDQLPSISIPVSSVAGLIGAIDAASLKAALGISAIGGNIAGAASYLAIKNLLAIATSDITDMTANGRSLVSAANYAAMKSLLAITTADIGSGTLADARLPTRIGLLAQTITNWNSAIDNGWYMGANVTNAPDANWYIGLVEAHRDDAGGYCTQTVHRFDAATASNTLAWRRHRVGGTFGAWYKLQISQAEQDARYVLQSTVKLQDYFQSTQQTITLNSNLTVAHGLGAAPSLYFAFIQCVTAEKGYAVGDEVMLAGGALTVSGYGVNIQANATSCIVIIAQTGVSIINKSTHVSDVATPANWRIVVRAWL